MDISFYDVPGSKLCFQRFCFLFVFALFFYMHRSLNFFSSWKQLTSISELACSHCQAWKFYNIFFYYVLAHYQLRIATELDGVVDLDIVALILLDIISR